MGTSSRSRVAARAAVVASAVLVSLMPSGATGSVVGQGVIDRAVYEVDPQQGGPESRYIATIRNEGMSRVEFGNGYEIARRTPEGWRRLSHHYTCAFTSEARILVPGASHSQRVGWLGRRCHYRTLPAGLYRVRKLIRYTDETSSSYREDTITARFRVAD